MGSSFLAKLPYEERQSCGCPTCDARRKIYDPRGSVKLTCWLFIYDGVVGPKSSRI